MITTIFGNEHDLGGGFKVQRILPNRAKRTVGPFVFLDHMGPFTAEAEQNTDVRPHPHIGLSTMTYLYEGSIAHKDSLGSDQLIKPGEVNWMTAGRGIAHSERTPSALKHKERALHGLQFWVALPDAEEDCAPDFAHYGSSVIPHFECDDYRMDLVAGEGFGLVSPVKVTSPLLFADFTMKRAQTVSFKDETFEIGIYVISGELQSAELKITPHQMLTFAPGQRIDIRAQAGTHFVAVGGPPMVTPRHIWWNLVSSSREKIEAAKVKWKEGLFEKVPGETEFIPLPNT